MYRGQFLQGNVVPFFQYSNFHIPFLAVTLISSTSLYLGLEHSIPLLLVAGSGAFLLYQLDRVWIESPEDAINQPIRVRWYEEHRKYTYVSCIIAILIGGIAFLFLSPKTIIGGLVLGTIGILYLLPNGRSLPRLKGNWLVKPLCIMICWAAGVVLLPVVESGVRIEGRVWSFFSYRSLLFAANVLLADLPDKYGDEKSSLRTLASFLPLRQLIQWVFAIAVLTFLVGLLHGMLYDWPLVLFLDLGGAIGMMVLARRALRVKVSGSHFIYSFINDLVLGWPVISLVAHFLFCQAN